MSYNGSGANAPSNIDGDAVIHDEGDCTISHSVTATGNITVTAGGAISTQGLTSSSGTVSISGPGAVTAAGAISANGDLIIEAEGAIETQGLVSTDGKVSVEGQDTVTINDAITSHSNTILSGTTVTAQDITSDWGVQVTATDGTITVVDVVSNNDDSSNGGNILMHATSDIGTGNLKNNGTSTIGGIEIQANESGTSSIFNIGGGGSNGTGTLDVRTVTGGGTANDSIRGGIWVSNGSTGSTGGISVSSMSDILLTASASRSGILFLDAKAGELTLPAGTLSSDGGANSGAGFIVLLANTIDTADGTMITASQNSGAAGTYHAVFIAASIVNTSGSSGLVIQANGDGVTGVPGSAAAGLVPEGSISLASTDVLNALYWSHTITDFLTRRDSVTITGSGSFKATANGNYNQLSVSGAPLNFTNDGDVTLEAKGAVEHNIKLGFFGTLTGSEGLVFTGSGDFKADASGVDGNGGKVEINGAVSEISSTSFVVKANGPTAGNGDGGTIKWFSSELSIDEASTVSFTADAALAGTGNAKSNAIDFRSDGGVIAIGTEAGQASFSAKGGSVSGNGGTIKFVSDGAVTVYGAGPTANVFDVSVPGDTGNGGKIDILVVQGITFDGDASYLKADSGSVSGDGGTIKIETSVEPVIIGTDETGAVDFSAKSNGDGKGGTVDIYSPVGLRADGAHINVSAAGSKQGGTISLNAGSTEDLYISGILRADGGTDGGDGGSIILNGGKVTLPGDANTEVKANGKSSGDGGQIDITTNFEGGIRIGNGTAEIRLEATSEDGGNGGTINLLAEGEMYLYGAAIDVSVLAGDGDGGTIRAESRSDIVTVVGDVNASGFGSGNGGLIELTAYLDMELTDASVRAPGGESGSGGEITITVRQEFSIDDTSEVSAQAGASGDGQGGMINLIVDGSVAVEHFIKADGVGAGAGGSIYIDTPTITFGETAILSAEGGIGTGGEGGEIEIKNSAASVPLTFSATAPIFKAKGYADKEGGSVTIDKVGNFDIHKLIEVNGGDTVSPGNKFGSIKLNGVTAQQWKTSNGSNWPQTYWKSFDTANADAVIATHATGLSDTAKGFLEQRIIGGVSQHPAQIYYMEKAAHFDTFFGTSSTSGTELGLSIPTIGVTAVFQKIGTTSVETSTGVSTIKQNTTAHELGHQFDYLAGALSQMPNTDPLSFAVVLESDYVGFDTPACGVVLPSFPCTTFTGTNSQKLEEWLATGKSQAEKRVEVFTHAFAHEMYPNTNFAELNSVFSSFTDTKTWMHGVAG